MGSMPASLLVQKIILRAELWAVLQALRLCSPPIQIHTDCAAVIQGLKKGSKRCGAADAKHADVWRLIWHHIEDIGFGSEGITVVKCKAHVTKKAISEATDEQREIIELNVAADDWAKRGAKADHPIEWHVQAKKEQHDKIMGIVKFLAYVEVTSRDINGDRSGAQKKAEKIKVKKGGKKRGRPPRSSRPREVHLWEGQEWGPLSHPFDKGALKDLVSGVVSGGMGHSLWRTGAWTWCHRCGLHSKSKVLG